ncbi:MAG TPA: hypothetical protein VJU85_04625 [Nitrososphaeraceae archaeon]|nr:hypothetical protein [Nitrososphaeraceae archaeon]
MVEEDSALSRPGQRQNENLPSSILFFPITLWFWEMLELLG